jgi:hypothetical protein
MEKKFTQSDIDRAIFTAFGAGWAAGESKKFKSPMAAWEELQKSAERKKRLLAQKR